MEEENLDQIRVERLNAFKSSKDIHMTKISKTGTSFFDIKKGASTQEFPNLFSNYLKSFGEVYFWEKGNFHVITRAHHAKDILTSADYSADRGSFFVSRMPNLDLSLIGDFFSVVKKMMVMSDDTAHSDRRKVAAAGFEDQVLEKFSQKLKKSVKALVAGIKDQKEFEFVETIAKKLPSTVLAELFSIPEEDRGQFLIWSNIMTGFFGGASEYRNEDGIEVNSAALSLKNYFKELVEKRRITPGDDYVSITLKMQKVFNITDDELISQLIMMLVAGMATTTDQMNNIMFLLATHPEMQDEVRGNLQLVPQMTEECKRFDPAVTFIFRVARNKTQIGDQPILPGDVMFISTHAINRDLIDSPDTLDIHRKAQHFAYGHGPHYCIGAKLGRMEIQQLFEELLREIPAFEIDPHHDSVRDHYSLSFSGFKKLYVRLK
jgi:cytochrome P450